MKSEWLKDEIELPPNTPQELIEFFGVGKSVQSWWIHGKHCRIWMQRRPHY